MYKIKHHLDDFLVWELPDYKLSEEGKFSLFWLRKSDYNTIDALKLIANKLNIPLKFIGFAGSKDKFAITEQVISVRANKDKVESLKLKDIFLDYIGQSDKPISLGELKGNRFKIVVRNLPKRFVFKSPNKIPNLFGPQRFSKSNIAIGRSLIKKNFKKALDLIDQRYVKEFLEDNPGNFIGAFRELPLKLQRLFIHSFQSFIWNETVKEFMETNPFRNEKIPLIGFGTILKDDALGKIIKNILRREDVSQRDFIIRQIPDISSEGSERDLFIKADNFDFKQEPDDEFKNKYKAIVSFSLPKGSYATTVISFLMSSI